MGNYKFKLSDMIPNAWFYKLKNTSKQHPTKNKNNKNHHPHHPHHPHHHQYLTSTTTTTSSSAPPPNHHHHHHHHHTTTPTTTTTTQTQEPISHSRHSYYFTRELIKPIQLLPNSPTNPKTTDIHFPPDPPRKSSSKKRRPNKKKKNNRTTIKPSSFTSSISSGCSCRATLESVWINNKSDSTPDYSVVSVSPDKIDFQDLPPDQFDSIGAGGAHSWSSTSCCSSTCRVSSSSPTENCEKIDGFFDAVSMLDLPPIITKPVKFSTKKATNLSSKIRKSCSSKIVKQESSMKTLKDHQKVIIRRPSAISPGLKIRLNSPRIISRKTTHSKDMTSRIAQSLLGPKAKQRTPPTTSTAFRSNTVQPSSRKPTSSISSTATINLKSRNKNVSDTFAIIKSSFDPQRDFRESMVEMIVENNIRTSRDLEELLACYLSLNSDEYHDLIVKVFEQIWFDLTEIRL